MCQRDNNPTKNRRPQMGLQYNEKIQHPRRASADP